MQLSALEGSGSVRPARRTRCVRRRLRRAHEGPPLARHRAQGAAGPHQPGASRRVRLRGQHRRRRRHPDADAGHVPAEGRALHAAGGGGVRRRPRLPAARRARSRRHQGSHRAHRRRGRADAARLARRAGRQPSGRRQRERHAAGLPAGVHRRRAASAGTWRSNASCTSSASGSSTRSTRWRSTRSRAASSTSSASRRTR